jgi:hypothetical protein
MRPVDGRPRWTARTVAPSQSVGNDIGVASPAGMITTVYPACAIALPGAAGGGIDRRADGDRRGPKASTVVSAQSRKANVCPDISALISGCYRNRSHDLSTHPLTNQYIGICLTIGVKPIYFSPPTLQRHLLSSDRGNLHKVSRPRLHGLPSRAQPQPALPDPRHPHGVKMSSFTQVNAFAVLDARRSGGGAFITDEIQRTRYQKYIARLVSGRLCERPLGVPSTMT